MANGSHVEFEGLPQLRAAIRKLGDKDLMKQLKAANDRASKEAEKFVVSYVPVSTGNLLSKTKASPTVSAARVKSSAPYAGPINYGWATRGILPREFMQKGLDAVTSDVIEIYADDVNDLIRKLGLS